MGKHKKSKITVEKVGSQVEESPQTDSPTDRMKGLRSQAVSLGMLPENVEKFESEDLLQDTINTMQAIRAEKTVVATVEKADPKEDRETERRWSNKAERQKAFFDSQPKVNILIPCEAKEKPGVVEEREVNGKMETVVVSGAVWSKTFNGYRVTVPKGVYTPVPQYVAENIAKEQNQIMLDQQRLGVDRIDPQTGRPVKEQL